MRAPSPALVLTDGEREVLQALSQALSRAQTATHGQVSRARALLVAADGTANTAIAAQVGVSPATVTAWRARFERDRLANLGLVERGRGRKPSIPKEKIDAIVDATLHSTPPGETHWSCRTMAKEHDVNPATVQRIWSARGLQPHRVETFKLSNDRRFEENSSTSSASTSTRRTKPSCCAWTRNPRSKRWTAPRPACR